MTISDEKVAEIKALIKKTINLPADTELSLATFGDKRSAFLNYGGPNQDSKVAVKVNGKLTICFEDINEKCGGEMAFYTDLGFGDPADEPEIKKCEALKKLVEFFKSVGANSDDLKPLKDRLVGEHKDIKHLDCVSLTDGRVAIYIDAEPKDSEDFYLLEDSKFIRLHKISRKKGGHVTAIRRDGQWRSIFESPNGEYYLVTYSYSFSQNITSIRKANGGKLEESETWQEEVGDERIMYGVPNK
ncbi:MAG: hypothetical protein A2921_03705 [Candidatus Magasanikbacteria bacterium RIFCSPLOWO2_01_FULL_43_20b]|uniref:Uncharacterized protein n=1 Tax=Candidatus Magasanikbacteria bacterium RIFCSPLOWO2_12_FULL_43_12 TaxID=1798692 RepID=A0A1F6MQZ0_9BACT|nr:MAG: hypothetical protein A3C74_00010 [Candidatus Magasanikbacteria bacterium RIFCSPHIGHO2_02_FULL_44_13]OGH72510.1 MAG: hypothetical protein A3I93_04295 [Candidatus Magasanikbacteria bacterium RIFCSPLOWO2_02_FULL_43_22]OGH73681.1 MAG: hypothetical protein A2921_03705 [Candidatus Magasanikbacteria bacterium RIFCSPLOWO2_01_FULL_43_20b]OGH74095.1 MAG: hypothetical protein A3G00_04965 [Candidatus Magasanikbacteria bacterium RIFCSPLOWO2_12_FULL_43_12]